jgi:putative transposase
MKLNLPRRTKKRLIRPMQPLDAPQLPNEVWSLDFMSDSLDQGRRFRTLNILDESVREALAIEIDTSLPAQRVVRALQQLETWRGLPKAIRLDNGPELTSQHLTDWCKDKGIELRFIQPGKPNQNAFIERFNRSYRTEVLNSWLFISLDEVREITHQWLQSYNEERPHDALGNVPSAVFRKRCSQGRILLLNCLLDGEAYDMATWVPARSGGCANLRKRMQG